MPELLAGDGIIAAEVGLGQATAAAGIFAAAGLLIDGIERDLAGVERCVVARMGESGWAVASCAVKKILECAVVASRVGSWRVRSRAGTRRKYLPDRLRPNCAGRRDPPIGQGPTVSTEIRQVP